MRAAVVSAHGEPPSYAEHPAPETGGDLVRVRITAAPIVPLDLLCASGTSYFGPPALPYVPGVQGVGITDSGERVWVSSTAGMKPGDGTLGEHCAVPVVDVVPLPDGVDDTVAAAFGLSGVAAWSALHVLARLRSGERVLVLGAGGAVGQVAVAVAKHHGAARVVGACRSEAAAARARHNGADAVVILSQDGDVEDLSAALGDALEGTADVVIDPVFGWVAEAALRVMTPFGRLVNLGGSAGDAAALSSAAVRGKSLSVLGYTNNAITPEQRAEALTSVLELARDGLATVEHRVRPLAEVADAWAELASGATYVRQVLVP
jgi:NADPH:quinone reductase-like Zn-dependent oxidoreductase